MSRDPWRWTRAACSPTRRIPFPATFGGRLSIRTTGELTHNIPGSPFDTGSKEPGSGYPKPRSVAVRPWPRFIISHWLYLSLRWLTTRVADPSGTFAYVANYGQKNVSGYKINRTTGALTEIPDDPLTEIPDGSPFPARGVGPYSVAVDPSGKFAYVANSDSDNVSGYTINPTTGALTAMAGPPFPAGDEPRSVAVDPSGKFAYVANFRDKNVSGYQIDPTTGALKEIPDDPLTEIPDGSPFPARGVGPNSVAVDPSGKFAYVANSEKSDSGKYSVSGYMINPTTGALTHIGSVEAGKAPLSVAIARPRFPRFIISHWLYLSLRWLTTR